jgi:hypothetical protein
MSPATGQSGFEHVPLSHNQMARISTVYGVDQWVQPPCVFGLHIQADINTKLLAQSLNVVAWRHSALRTFFPRDAAPAKAACAYPTEAHWDLQVAEASGDGLADGELVKWLHQPFEPWQPPLMRAALLRQGPADWLLGLAVDHLNFDGASVGGLALDLSHVWRRLAEGAAPHDLAEPVAPYTDFIEWQRDWMGRFGASALAYWMPRWKANSMFPELPIARTGRPRDLNAVGRIWERAVPLAALQRIHEAIGVGNAYYSPFMLIAAALFHILSKSSQDDDLALLFPFANRLMPGSERAIGYYSNRLILTIPRPVHPNLKEIAEAVRNATISGLEYGSLPFGVISSMLFAGETGRRPASGYLFLNVQDSDQVYSIPGGRAVSVPIDSAEDFADYPSLTVICTLDHAADQMILRCAYSTRFYAEGTVSDFMSDVLDTLVQGA